MIKIFNEFTPNPERQCRAKGHVWSAAPHSASSYHDTKKNRKVCSRCGIWDDELDNKK